LSTEIYKWAQRYSFTELSSAIQETRRRDRKTRVIFVAALLVPSIAIFTLTVLLPLAEDPLADYFPEPTANNPVPLAANQTVSGIGGPASNGHQTEDIAPRVHALMIEQAFIKSRETLAAGDSLALSIDLVDSVASIELAGVQVRRCKIESIKMTGKMQRLRQHRAAPKWLSNPFELNDATASIPKIPLRVIEAPRDTAEAKARNDEVIAVEKGDVYFTLYFDKYLSLTISQSQQTSARGWPSRINYWLKRGWASARKDLKTLAQLKLPTSRLHVRIEMSREDATAIYRALPANAQMALRF
jgi:hypothetical protein